MACREDNRASPAGHIRTSRTPLIRPILLAAAAATPALADKPVHSVTGSGLVVLDFFDPDLVHDLGGPGQDIMHIEYVPEEITCSDEVELFPLVIERGNFQVK